MCFIHLYVCKIEALKFEKRKLKIEPPPIIQNTPVQPSHTKCPLIFCILFQKNRFKKKGKKRKVKRIFPYRLSKFFISFFLLSYILIWDGGKGNQQGGLTEGKAKLMVGGMAIAEAGLDELVAMAKTMVFILYIYVYAIYILYISSSSF